MGGMAQYDSTALALITAPGRWSRGWVEVERAGMVGYTRKEWQMRVCDEEDERRVESKRDRR